MVAQHEARMSSRWVALALAGILTTTTLTAQSAGATESFLVDNSGGNASISGFATSTSGRPVIGVENQHRYWTALTVVPTGLTLSPGPGLEGVYAELGLLGPEATAIWSVTFDPTKYASALILASPTGRNPDGSRTSKGLGAGFALNVLEIIIQAAPPLRAAKLQIDRTDLLIRAARLVTSVLADYGVVPRDPLTETLVVKDLVSGRLAGAILDALGDPVKAQTIVEALALLGIKVSAKELALSLTQWGAVFDLLQIAFDMAQAAILGTSSGGVFFSAAGVLATTTPSTPVPVSTATDPVASVLQYGSSGPLVAQLQQMLVDAGLSVGRAGVDAQFGRATETAVKELQRGCGLPVTGVVDPATLSLAQRESAKRSCRATQVSADQLSAYLLTNDGIGPLQVGISIAAAQEAVGGALTLYEEISPGCRTGYILGADPELGMIFLDGALASVAVGPAYPPGPSAYSALASIHIGSAVDDVKRAFPGLTSTNLGDYDLVVSSADPSSDRLLVFTIDGSSLTVASMRAGVYEAVSLPEGCA
jgi:hypothetical protein